MAKKKEKSATNYEYIPIDIIQSSLQNDQFALEYIINRYQSYIDKLASYRVRDRNGKYFTILDEDKKQQIEEALILGIRRFRIKDEQ